MTYKTTIQDYVQKHSKSDLAQELLNSGLPGNTKIQVGSGRIVFFSGGSNICRALKSCKSHLYYTGGRVGKNPNDGHHFAVIDKSEVIK